MRDKSSSMLINLQATKLVAAQFRHTSQTWHLLIATGVTLNYCHVFLLSPASLPVDGDEKHDFL